MAFNLAGFAQGISPAVQQYIQQQQANQTAQGLMNYIAQQQAATPPPASPPSAPIGGPGSTPISGNINALGGAQSLMPNAMPSMPQVSPVTAALARSTSMTPGSIGSPSGAAGSPPTPDGSVAAGPPPATAGPSPGGPGLAGGATQLSGVAQGTQDPMQRNQQNLGALIMGLRKANPRARPSQIMGMAEQYLGMLKGVDDSDKQMMKEQIDIWKAQASFNEKHYEANLRDQDVDKRIDEDREKYQAQIADRDRIEKSKEDARSAALQLTLQARAAEGAANRATRMGVAEVAAGASRYRTDTGLTETQIRANVAEYDAKLRSDTTLTKDQADNQVKEYEAELRRQTGLLTSAFGGQAPAGLKASPQRPDIGAPPAARGAAGRVAGDSPPRKLKPLPDATLQQWKQIPKANRPAARQSLQGQGYDVSALPMG